MEPEFWKQRWAERKIGFHEGAPNAFLVEHAGRLAGRVLVPLCGKAEDLAYLASRGHEVVGVELVEDAVVEFFAEHGLVPELDDAAERLYRVYRCGPIALIVGDWFHVTREMVGTIDSIYDRAALIALPPTLRALYVAHAKTVVAPGTPGLLVTVDYDQARIEGPPFSVPDDEVRRHYAQVELLAERPAEGGRIADANIGALERCYAVGF